MIPSKRAMINNRTQTPSEGSSEDESSLGTALGEALLKTAVLGEALGEMRTIELGEGLVMDTALGEALGLDTGLGDEVGLGTTGAPPTQVA